MEFEPDVETKISIISKRIELWHNTQFQSIVDLRVAEKIGDSDLKKSAEANVRQCEAAILVLEEMLKPLEQELQERDGVQK